MEIDRALLQDVLEDLCELRGERAWWKDEPRRGYQTQYNELCTRINKLKYLLRIEET